MDVKEEKENYNKIFFDIPSAVTDLGNPALPTINQLFALPNGSACKVSVAENSWTDVEIGKIYPYQNPLYGKKEVKAESFSINQDAYNSEIFSPFLSRVGDLQKYRGMSNRNISICPFRYYPLANKLSILKEFEIRVDYDDKISEEISYNEDISIFANSNVLKDCSISAESSRNSNDYDYLIIVGDIPNIINSQALADFRKWKAIKGLKTKIVSTSTTGTSASQIKQYISSESASYGIKYVLFIGDYNKIPLYTYSSSTFTGYGLPINSDYWYGCLDGNNDYQADVFVGRFPINSLYDLENMVDKTIRYEKNTISYYNKALLVADFVVQHRTHMEGIASNTYTTPYVFTNLDGGLVSYGGHNNSNADVINAINSGYNIVNFFGHGIKKGWGESESAGWNYYYELFSDSCLSQINSTANFVLFNIACNTGDITNSQCMLKSYQCSDHGAVSVLGATNISLFDANKTFIQYLYDKLLNIDIDNLGELITLSHISNISTMGIDAIINAVQYICGGDPSLQIWTKSSGSFENISISNIGNALTINSPTVSGYKVSVVSENGELLDTYDVSGASDVISIPICNCYIALNKKGYAPYIISVNVEDNYIQNTSFSDFSVYINSPLTVGNNVTTLKPYGNVSIESGGHVILKKGQGVTITNGFECKSGAILEIKD
jgi:gingipain R